MAVTGTKISQLDPAGALVGTEVTPIVQSGATVKTTLKAIADLEKEEIINDLTTGGATKFASAETVKTLGEEKVDKVAGKSLIADTEITRLSGVTNQTKQTLGLENVDNTSDLNKPVSTATQTALNGKVNTTDVEQVRSQATNKVASSKLLDDELALKEDLTNKKSVINLTSETDYPTSKGVADVIIPAEQVTAESLAVLNRRIEALETIIANSQYSKIDVLDEFNLFGKTNLIILGATSPSITPDFIGQFYINTTAGITYQSNGIGSSGDWKQTSN